MTNRAPRKTNQELLHDIYSATHELLKTEAIQPSRLVG